jgi:hypothetical protein
MASRRRSAAKLLIFQAMEGSNAYVQSGDMAVHSLAELGEMAIDGTMDWLRGVGSSCHDEFEDMRAQQP